MRLSTRTALILFIVALTGACAFDVDRDLGDAIAAATQVHLNMQVANFAAIYRESAPRFKSTESESQFVSRMQEFFRQSGNWVKAEDVGHQSGSESQVGRIHTFDFIVDYEHGQFRERMSFARSDSNNGQMQLWKLDVDPKK